LNFYLLTLLVFLFHQVFELCDVAFQASLAKAGSKRLLWEKFRSLIDFFSFDTWKQFLGFYLHRDDYGVRDGHVACRLAEQPPPVIFAPQRGKFDQLQGRPGGYCLCQGLASLFG
jgi:hypothetical protein